MTGSGRAAALLAVGLFLGRAAPLPGQGAPPPGQSAEGEVFLYQEIDRRPKLLPGTPLFYPAEPLVPKAKVVLMLVVDTNGTVDRGTVKVLSSPDPAFTAAAKAMVYNSRYRPGQLRDLKVRVLMQQELAFKPLTPPCDSIVVLDGVRLCSLTRKDSGDR